MQLIIVNCTGLITDNILDLEGFPLWLIVLDLVIESMDLDPFSAAFGKLLPP
jgi:hypothetical protein